MFTSKDIEYRTIFVLNCIAERTLRVSSGELLVEEKVEQTHKMKTLTKIPFQKVLALFVIGHIKITTPLIEKCQKFGVSLVVMKPNFRPVFFWANMAEANFLLHQRQYDFDKNNLTIAKCLVTNKIQNQIKILKDTRRKDVLTVTSITECSRLLDKVKDTDEYEKLMGVEGLAAKIYFSAFFQDLDWSVRRPRTKCDALNATLDIGYTLLFNYIECFLRMFGFDVYVGVYHRLWFKRKSLVCDLVEPFRCIVDRTVRTSFHRKQFSSDDFEVKQGEYILKRTLSSKYHKVFFDALIPYKKEIYLYVQAYYRCFMRMKSVENYPQFIR
ncbi:type V CRISPR-associated endonuclease Cas1 [Prevotella ihumii]|uniref:type V CRISPR-associated endonuclease Cas1 n=1 Tax=Prevotella ihumii TaxID=1917878 RepID=UPI0009818846|nr:type V CRISPR-associated endonuclease Cas1 [Prevotella ihumii]